MLWPSQSLALGLTLTAASQLITGLKPGVTATSPFQSHEAKPLDPIPNDHESGPEKWMSIFGISHEFNRSLPEGFSRSGLRSLLRLEVAVEIYHQRSGAGRVDLPLARDCGSGAGDE